MGVVDERDQDQSFADWFIHGSRKKKENKRVQLVDPTMAESQTSQQLQSTPNQAQPMQVSKEVKELSFDDMINQSKSQLNNTASLPLPPHKPVTQAPAPIPMGLRNMQANSSKQLLSAPPKPITQNIPVTPKPLSAPVQNVPKPVTQTSIPITQNIPRPTILAPTPQPALVKPMQQKQKGPVSYQKFVISRQRLNPIPKDAKEAVYPLISPYAYTEIKDTDGALIYRVIEPSINEEEKLALEKLKTALIHFIDLPINSITDERQMINFLEEKVLWLLEETDITVPAQSYAKIMYYLYRDFVGLNQLEPLLRDPYIEDIACDGNGVNLYVVHQRFGTIRTNIIFEDEDMLRELVVKLSQRCNRYVSYAEPLLDGSLPDGTRVNATLARDVTSRGPTFSIRKFRDKPFSPIEMMNFNTADADILTYLWFIIENGSNILLCGGTGTGKTSLLNMICMFVPEEAKIVSIEDSVTGDSRIIIRQDGKIRNLTIKEFVDNRIDAEVMTLDEKGKIVFTKPSNYIKHVVKKDIYEVLTSTGRKVKVTQDHSLFTLKGTDVEEIKPTDLRNGSFIAVPRCLPVDGQEINEISVMNNLEVFKDDFLCGEPVKKIFEKYTLKEFDITQNKYNWYKKNDLIKIEELLKLNIEFSYDELKQLRIKSKNKTSIPVIFEINKEFLEFCGLWIGDGSYDNHNKNVVIISNVDEECREVFRKIAAYTGSNYSVMTDKGVSLRLHSTIFYKFMKYVLKFDGYSSTKIIPDFIFGLSNEQIKHFIRGYFSADGWVKKYEVSCASQSYQLLEDLQTMFLRIGIISRINDFDRTDRCINMSISSSKNIQKFKQIGFLQNRKNDKLGLMNKTATHAYSDIIPLDSDQLSKLNEISEKRVAWAYGAGLQNLGREHVQELAPKGSEFNDLSHNDIFWDRVKSVKKINSDEIEVFDLSIPKYEKFLCNNIFVHNTRELRLHHENWLPAVARVGFGGTKTGEVTMFDLLKESFRQNPNYIIVGEVRGEEAAVMFQAMASGMTAMSTMHAGSADDALKRLMTRPISLPSTLMETLDVLIVMTHAYEKGASARRIKEIVEIEHVDSKTDRVVTNKAFAWNPAKDNYIHNKTDLLEEIGRIKGYSKDYVKKEMVDRKRVIEWLVDKNFDWKEVTQYFAEYKRNKQKIMDLVAGKTEKELHKEKSHTEHSKVKHYKVEKHPKTVYEEVKSSEPPKPSEEINLNLIS
ncbi:MAG: ATPase, T2SS/T4P/T4SS family [Candidatus Aenigmatarchaeota archaeon]